MASREFEVRYAQKCAACGDLVKIGEWAQFNNDNDLVHTKCIGIRTQVTETVCSKCFLTSCDCEK